MAYQSATINLYHYDQPMIYEAIKLRAFIFNYEGEMYDVAGGTTQATLRRSKLKVLSGSTNQSWLHSLSVHIHSFNTFQ